MTPRERVLTTLSFCQPDRTPFAWGFGMTPEMNAVWSAWLAQHGLNWSKFYHATTDTLGVGPDYIGPALKPNQPVYVGIWGIETRRVSYGAGTYDEFETHPLAGLEHPADLKRIAWPTPDWFDYSNLERQIATLDPACFRAVQLGAGNPFEIYCWMTGMEEAMVNLLANPELVEAALDRICTYFEQNLKRCVEAVHGRVDLLFFGDDLGSQEGLLISPESYRQVIQPFHRRLIVHGRRLVPQVRTLFHSDGAVFDILPDVIAAGVDVLEAVQTDAAGMNPERLKKAYGDRLAFHGGVPVQSLLPHGSVEDVRRECGRLCRILGQDGGYIAAPTHAIQAGTPPENVWAMLETVLGQADLDRACAVSRL